MTQLTQEQVFHQIRNSSNPKVKVAVTDIDGVLRGKYIHRDKFFSAVEGGFGFCDVIFGWDINDLAYENMDFTGWHTGYPDAVAHLDLKTSEKFRGIAMFHFFLVILIWMCVQEIF